MRQIIINTHNEQSMYETGEGASTLYVEYYDSEQLELVLNWESDQREPP